ncbi:AraC family transcriptional regulator [Cohnella lubricantis]|uniref:AraC family transcriptional regulator n=1 Tax=Cohnella lubricantis TaxID=2163172 RepID=A0A841TG98_9BACL|nr:AraC family transcriptional regulator [Cohnella lubricantis]MBB6679135.1 AraC family transcriptional regulator [Cohnella lubricantis]MBP2120171.1 AraC-like DNA-binding protein [Cohnella lubricantis]
MDKPIALWEPMPMPDPHFPMKLHHCRFDQYGATTFPYHWHEHLEFLYFVEGEARITCNSSTYDVGPGDLIVVNSTDLHHGVSLSDHLFYFAVILDPSLLHSQSPDAVETKYIMPITQNRIMFASRISGDPAVSECIDTLIREYTSREFGYELAVKSCLYRLLALLLRNYVQESQSPQAFSARLRHLERFGPVFRYIEEHYGEKISVEQLAAIASLSRYHFSRQFKELTNKTVSDYVNFVRIGKAETLLRHSSLSISEIASMAGFSDIYYFSKLFKAHKRVPPTRFRSEGAAPADNIDGSIS